MPITITARAATPIQIHVFLLNVGSPLCYLNGVGQSPLDGQVPLVNGLVSAAGGRKRLATKTRARIVMTAGAMAAMSDQSCGNDTDGLELQHQRVDEAEEQGAQHDPDGPPGPEVDQRDRNEPHAHW